MTHHPETNHRCHDTGPTVETKEKENQADQNKVGGDQLAADEIKKHGTTWKEIKKAAQTDCIGEVLGPMFYPERT